MNELMDRLDAAVSGADFDDLETLAELASVLEENELNRAVDEDVRMVAFLFWDAVHHSGIECSCASCMQWRIPDLRRILLGFEENACSGEIEDLANFYVVYVLAWAKDNGIRFKEILEAAKANKEYDWRVRADIQETLDFLIPYKDLPSGLDAYYRLLSAISIAGLTAKNPFLFALIRQFFRFVHKMGEV